jgi:threonine synthase
MNFYSTRDQNKSTPKTISQAILEGLADDGGLFVPEYYPQFNWENLNPALTYPKFAALILTEYFKNEPVAAKLNVHCKNVFSIPIPLHQLTKNTYVMELFHGPTLSFKDFGARFLASILSELITHTAQNEITIMVATSGDTGSAIASAFHHKPNTKVVILFPRGQISKRQEQQITCFSDNIIALEVAGNFDDCQKIVKAAFKYPQRQQQSYLSSANSINIGRLLPQLTYYAYISWQFYLQQGQAPGFIIPTGNLGNATAAFWAKRMGLPIREIALSTNANRTLVDYVDTGEFKPRPSISTLANAMDVGNPSNFERLRQLYHSWEEFKAEIKVISATDLQIIKTITKVYNQFAYIMCPHTATGYFALAQLNSMSAPWIIAATANPCKFETIIEPLINKTLTIPAQLQNLLSKTSRKISIHADIAELIQYLESKKND